MAFGSFESRKQSKNGEKTRMDRMPCIESHDTKWNKNEIECLLMSISYANLPTPKFDDTFVVDSINLQIVNECDLCGISVIFYVLLLFLWFFPLRFVRWFRSIGVGNAGESCNRMIL